MERLSRRERILKYIVEEFIKTANPIGSQTLIKQYNLPYSSATVRNEMLALEIEGYLEKPHTSAGRIPSSKGYRYYIDNLREKTLDNDFKNQIQTVISNRTMQLEEVIKHSCEILSQMTNLTSIVLGPDAHYEHLTKIQLIPISEATAVCVFVTDRGYVEHRTFNIPNNVELKDMENCVEILNNRLTGTPILEVVEKINLLKPIIEDKVQQHEILFKSFMEAFLSFTTERVAVYGKENIYEMPEFTNDINKLKTLIKLLEKDEIWKNLSNRDGVVVKIGTENTIGALKDASVITTTINVGGNEKGTIALIGPTRMDYDRVIEAVNFVSQKINELLEGDDS